MLISASQQEANRRNAQSSTGPHSLAGKNAVRCNALKHGLRAKSTVLPFEDRAEFDALLREFAAEWLPQTFTEGLHVEQLAIHQWLLRRLANFEGSIFTRVSDPFKQMEMLERFSNQRARLEGSFSKTLRDLERLQAHRAPAAEPEPLPDNVQTTEPEPQLESASEPPLPRPALVFLSDPEPAPALLMASDFR